MSSGSDHARRLATLLGFTIASPVSFVLLLLSYLVLDDKGMVTCLYCNSSSITSSMSQTRICDESSLIPQLTPLSMWPSCVLEAMPSIVVLIMGDNHHFRKTKW